ncbi:hypothetical protein XFF6992_170040 [Xanthomonas citri pv. fuscans]|nr:hypothetical protein XFF6992_170040 [Xanthomonas citri pv. fuscans]SOO36230.1 hypothetical protein XFF6994_840009 [Xanthomonas citri pv. fuscans]
MSATRPKASAAVHQRAARRRLVGAWAHVWTRELDGQLCIVTLRMIQRGGAGAAPSGPAVRQPGLDPSSGAARGAITIPAAPPGQAR